MRRLIEEKMSIIDGLIEAANVPGVKKNKDYRILDMPGADADVYIPLNWEAAKALAWKTKGPSGEWLIAHEKNPNPWRKEIREQGWTPIFFIGKKDKIMVYVKGGDVSRPKIFDRFDNERGAAALPLVGYSWDAEAQEFIKDLKANSGEIARARRVIDKVPLPAFRKAKKGIGREWR